MKKTIIIIIVLILCISLVFAAQSQRRTDYLASDGLSSLDIALNGSVAVNQSSTQLFNWTVNAGSPIYDSGQVFLGNLSILIPAGAFHQANVTDNATFAGEVSTFIYDDGDGTAQWDLRISPSTTTSVRIGVCNGFGGCSGFTEYTYDDGGVAECDENAISRSNGWHNFTFIYTNSSRIEGYIDSILCHVFTGRDGIKDAAMIEPAGLSQAFFDVFFISSTSPPRQQEIASYNTPPTPVNDTVNNTLGSNISISCSEGSNGFIWFGNESYPINLVRIGTSSETSWIINSSLVTEEKEYFFKGGCDNSFALNSSVQEWTFDNSTPGLTLGGNNFFNTDNFSTQFQYQDNVTTNITFTDNLELFGFIMNITLDGVSCFNFTNTSLSGTTHNFTKTIDISNCGSGTHDIELFVADGHTKQNIDDYEIIEKNKEIKFVTPEENTIWIQSSLDSTTSTFKKRDRYEIEFDFGNTVETKKEFIIKSYTPIVYKPNSRWKAHFVILNGKQGNWIDFEGLEEEPEVTKLPTVKDFPFIGRDVYSYRITFYTSINKITFNSIGTLNTFSQNFTWFKGRATTRESTNLSEAIAILTLNLTTSQSISSINADLRWNNTAFNPTLSNTSSNVVFTQQVTIPTLTKNQNITYVWNITIIQGDGSITTGNFTRIQTATFWDLDNCTLYSTRAINFTFKDELNQSTVSLEAIVDFNFTTDTTTKRYQATMEDRTNFSICITPSTINFTSDYTIQYSSASYASRRFKNASQNLDSSTQLIDLFALELVQGIFARFQTVDTLGNIIAGTTAVSSRTIGGISRTLETQLTDASGIASFFVSPDFDYTYKFTKTGFPDTTVTLRTTSTDLNTIVMGTAVTAVGNSTFTGINYQFKPQDATLNNNTNFDFQFNMTSTFWTITNCTMRLKKSDGTLLNETSGGFTAVGCDIRITGNTANFSKIISEAIWAANTTNIVTVQREYNIQQVFQGQFSLMSFFDDIRAFSSAGFSDQTRLLMVFFTILIILVLINQRIELPNPEGNILILIGLVWLFSFVQLLTITNSKIPIAFGPLQQYIIALLISIAGFAYMLWRHS